MFHNGEMAEWFKAAVLKTAVGVGLPWVRIPLSPPSALASFVRFPARASGAGARRCREALLRRRHRLAPRSPPSALASFVRFPARASGAGARRCREALLRRRHRLAPRSPPSALSLLDRKRTRL